MALNQDSPQERVVAAEFKMNRQEAEQLNPGARVLYLAGEPTACTGTVLAQAPQGVKIEWDDSETGLVLYTEMLNVERYDGPPVLPTVRI